MAAEDLRQRAEHDGGVLLLDSARHLDIAGVGAGSGLAAQQQHDGPGIATVRIHVALVDLRVAQLAQVLGQQLVADFQVVERGLDAMVRQHHEQRRLLLDCVRPLSPVVGQEQPSEALLQHLLRCLALALGHQMAAGEGDRIHHGQAAPPRPGRRRLPGVAGSDAFDDFAQRPETEHTDDRRVVALLVRHRRAANRARRRPGAQGVQPGAAQGGLADRVAAVIDKFQRHVAVRLQVQQLDALARVGETLVHQLVVQAGAMARHVAQQHAHVGVIRVQHRVGIRTGAAGRVALAQGRMPAHDQLLGCEQRFVQPLDRHPGIAEVETAGAATTEHAQAGRRRRAAVQHGRRVLIAEDESGIHRLAVRQFDYLAPAGLNPNPHRVLRLLRFIGGQRERLHAHHLEHAAAVTEHDLGADVALTLGHLQVQIAVAAARAARGRQQQRLAVAVVLPAAIAPHQLHRQQQTFGRDVHLRDGLVRHGGIDLGQADPAADDVVGASDEGVAPLPVVQDAHVDLALLHTGSVLRHRHRRRCHFPQHYLL